MYSHYIEAVSIHNQDRGNKQDAKDGPSSETTTTTTSSGLITFTMKDLCAIQVILFVY